MYTDHSSSAFKFKSILSMAVATLNPVIILLVITLGCASSVRVLDEVGPLDQASGSSSLPNGQVPVVAPTSVVADGAVPADPALPDGPDSTVPATEIPVPQTTTPAPTLPTGPGVPVSAASGAAAKPDLGHPQLSFFMHDVLGGSSPSARVVTGIIAASGITGVPFSKPSDNIFPPIGGVPFVNGNFRRIPNINGIINNQNLPFIAGLNAAQLRSNTVLQNTGNSNQVPGGGNQPFVSAGQLPADSTLQQLLFGSITVFDDELTEGHELGSSVIGRAQGFYMASSLDGTSHTIAATVMLHGKERGDVVEDTISLFGVHRMASEASQVAVIGGTGKYEHAKGYTTMESLRDVHSHTTDGVDTVYQFNVYLSE